MSNTSSTIAILIIADIINANFTMPMKYAWKWAWENNWPAWTVFALVLLPLVAALPTIPNLSMFYRSATPDMILEVWGFGTGWGLAAGLFRPCRGYDRDCTRIFCRPGYICRRRRA